MAAANAVTANGTACRPGSAGRDEGRTEPFFLGREADACQNEFDLGISRILTYKMETPPAPKTDEPLPRIPYAFAAITY